MGRGGQGGFGLGGVSLSELSVPLPLSISRPGISQGRAWLDTKSIQILGPLPEKQEGKTLQNIEVHQFRSSPEKMRVFFPSCFVRCFVFLHG